MEAPIGRSAPTCWQTADLGRPLPAIYSLRLADEFADAQVQGFDHDSEAGSRLPRFSPNSFLSLLLHGFGASAFARNAYG